MRLLSDALGTDGHVAGLGNLFQGLAFVSGITFDCLDKVGDQVVPALELNIDLGPGVLELVAQANQAVVDTNQPGDQGDQDNAENNADAGQIHKDR